MTRGGRPVVPPEGAEVDALGGVAFVGDLAVLPVPHIGLAVRRALRHCGLVDAVQARAARWTAIREARAGGGLATLRNSRPSLPRKHLQ